VPPTVSYTPGTEVGSDMEPSEVDVALDGAELVALSQGSLPDVKRLVERCREADIPARLGRDAGCRTGGCSPQAQLLVRREDVPQATALLQRDWLDAAHREGTLAPELLERLRAAAARPDGEPPCPACGHVGPLEGGACADCGLQLE
jgi:hypothetical protein